MPSAAGRDFELQPTLQSLEPFRDRLNIVSGLKLPAAYVGESLGRPRITRARRSAGSRARPRTRAPSPTSADQVAARHIGQETPLPSLELALESGASISYLHSANAAADGDEPARRVRAPARRRQHARGARRAAAAALEPARFRDGRGRVAASAICPARTASAWTAISTDVRELERRLALAADSPLAELDVPDKPNGIPADFEEHAMLMFDLLALAWQADLTRIATLHGRARAQQSRSIRRAA